MVIRFMIILFNNSYFVQKLNNNIIGLENTFLNQVNNIMELKKKWLFGQINTKLCKNYLSIYRHSAIGLSAFFICFLYLHSSQKKLRGDALFVKNADTKIMQIVPLLIQTTISSFAQRFFTKKMRTSKWAEPSIFFKREVFDENFL